VAAERLRLFVALDLPVGVRAALAGWALTAVADPPAPARLRPLPAESLHVTLCFLGGCDAADVDDIAGACSCAVAGRSPAIETALAEPVWLPPRRPRVLAVALADVAGGLAALQGRLADALTAGGWYRREARPYLPHVTVARCRDLRRPAELREPPAVAFTAGTVSLYRSRPGGSGARYDALASVVLAPR
jgi:2'-5' RNA ligase